MSEKIITVALNKLEADPLNVRKTYSAESIKELAASIKAKGIIQNLAVRKAGNSGKYLVSAGGRRLRAAQLLAEAGDLAADYPINCRVVTEAEAREISLAENIMREAMLGSVSQLSCWVARPSWLWARITGHIKEGTWTSGSSVPAAKRGQRLRRRRHHKLVHEVQD